MLDLTGLVDIKIVIVLLIVGAMIKHIKIFNGIVNKTIPYILMAIGVVMSVYTVKVITLTSVLIGVVSGALAVGIHSSGKNLWQLMGISLMNSTYMANSNTINNGAAVQEKNNIEASGNTTGIKISQPTSSLWEVKDPNPVDNTSYTAPPEVSYNDTNISANLIDDNEEISYDVDDNAMG